MQQITRRLAVYLETHCNIGSNSACKNWKKFCTTCSLELVQVISCFIIEKAAKTFKLYVVA